MFQQTLWTQWAPIMHLSWVQRTLWNKSRKKSYEFFKIGLLHKYGVHYEFHANPPIFKKSKNDQKPHKFKNHLTRCFTNILKLDLGWSNFNFGIFVYPGTSPLCCSRFPSPWFLEIRSQFSISNGVSSICFVLSSFHG